MPGTLPTQLLNVNFACQPDWATVPRYLVKHFSGYFCEGDSFFSMIFILK